MAIYLGNQKVKPSGISKIYVGEQLVYQSAPSEPDYFCVTALGTSAEIAFEQYGSGWTPPILQYKINDDDWTDYFYGDVLRIDNGDKCYWKGDNDYFSVGDTDYIYFVPFDEVAISGNIMTLIDSTGQSTTIPNYFCFNFLFKDAYMLIDAHGLKLPATTLADSCYSNMFQNCTSLTTAPKLPATTLDMWCYYQMFYCCTSLTTAPQLPATSLATGCYQNMFDGCTSLTTAPQLPATTLPDSCYTSMFDGCTSLYVSDTQTSDAPYAWRIPTNSTFSEAYLQDYMFYDCAGTRSSDDMDGEEGQSYTYYTQNPPV